MRLTIAVDIRALGRHFLLRVRGPYHLNFQGPEQNLKSPSIEIHYQFANFGRSIGPQAKFHKGPIGFSRAQGPYLQALESQVYILLYIKACETESPKKKSLFFVLWGRDQIDAISQTTFSNAFSRMKMNEFRLRFHWSLFLGSELTILQHWFR